MQGPSPMVATDLNHLGCHQLVLSLFDLRSFASLCLDEIGIMLLKEEMNPKKDVPYKLAL